MRRWIYIQIRIRLLYQCRLAGPKGGKHCQVSQLALLRTVTRGLWPSGSGHLGRQRSCPVTKRRRVQHGSIAFRHLPPKDVVNQCLEFGASQNTGCCVHPVSSADTDEVWQKSLILHRRSSLCCCCVARMSVDILRTSWDQCVSMV